MRKMNENTDICQKERMIARTLMDNNSIMIFIFIILLHFHDVIFFSKFVFWGQPMITYTHALALPTDPAERNKQLKLLPCTCHTYSILVIMGRFGGRTHCSPWPDCNVGQSS